jgi:tripartite-type tricarboxylate transporter receptor subunit TctC
MKKLTASLASLLLATASFAQTDYPSKPVKIISPFPAGGTSDVMARLIADELTKALKQPFIVDNRGGAGGTIGTEAGAKAAPDGYTLIQTGVGQNAVAHGLNPKLGYDSLKDFVHITQVNYGPNVLVVHPSSPFKTLKDLIDYGKTNPGKLNYGITNAASGHMAMELLKQAASECKPKQKDCKGLFMVAIPYRGGGPMLTDMLGGVFPVMFLNQDTVLPHVKSGKLRPLAVSSLTRNPLYPDVPTVAESGYPGFNALSWSGLSAPKGTPQVIVDKIETAAVAALKSPAVKERLERLGFVVPELGSKAYTAFLKTELQLWTKVIQTANIKPE